jgi:hypothetical protein
VSQDGTLDGLCKPVAGVSIRNDVARPGGKFAEHRHVPAPQPVGVRFRARMSGRTKVVGKDGAELIDGGRGELAQRGNGDPGISSGHEAVQETAPPTAHGAHP